MRTRIALIAASLCAIPAFADPLGSCLVDKAREQIGVTVRYDGGYQRIAFPGGDVPADRGVCTDVLIRAYRRVNLDLQDLVHSDMSKAWAQYPRLWGLSRPDTNIDHRRVPNLATFFARNGTTLAISGTPSAYAAGDIVTWELAAGVPHVGIVSDKKTADGTPLVVHNIGRGTAEENMLFNYTITGHYRYTPASMSQACAANGSRPEARPLQGR
jgi:uncharacterized protein